MKLTYEGLRDVQAWEKAGVLLPPYDPKALSERTRKHPLWVHFGIGNIFRIFIGSIADRLVREGAMDRGVTCVVLGGVSVNGGIGRISGVVAGVLIIGSLTNGMILLNVSEYTQMVVKGLVLAAAVGLDCMSNKRKTN